MKDLVILVPDKNMELGVTSLLYRHHAIGIREISFDIYCHPQRDPGIYHHSVEFLRQYIRMYDFALIFLDYEGSGKEHKLPDRVKNELKAKLERNGWRSRVEVILIVPELEIWIWVESDEVAKILGWNRYSEIQRRLLKWKLLQPGNVKPRTPKEAFEKLLFEKGIPRSSSIYSEIASKVDIHQCQDDNFSNLMGTLRRWFPIEI